VNGPGDWAEVAVQFKRPPLALFARGDTPQIDPNVLAIRIQPDEGILLRFGSKVPGLGFDIRPVTMDFTYGSSFAADAPDAYETLLLDAMVGDATLFARHDFVEASWALITPVHETWRKERAATIPTYEAGEWGPPEADALVAREGRRWRTL